jgi:hypothetical protein
MAPIRFIIRRRQHHALDAIRIATRLRSAIASQSWARKRSSRSLLDALVVVRLQQVAACESLVGRGRILLHIVVAARILLLQLLRHLRLILHAVRHASRATRARNTGTG